MSPKAKKLLIVVDMQPYFCTVKPDIIESVRKEVVKFKRESVIFLEYNGFGDTVEKLTKAAKKPIVIAKDDIDGSKFVEQWIKENGKPSEIFLCGVETCQCVGSTALSLAKNHDKVKIIEKAVGCVCSNTSLCRRNIGISFI